MKFCFPCLNRIKQPNDILLSDKHLTEMAIREINNYNVIKYLHNDMNDSFILKDSLSIVPFNIALYHNAILARHGLDVLFEFYKEKFPISCVELAVTLDYYDGLKIMEDHLVSNITQEFIVEMLMSGTSVSKDVAEWLLNHKFESIIIL
jgi:hypothetical protein